MSIESKIESLVTAIEKLTTVLSTASFSVPVTAPQAMTVPVAAPVASPVVVEAPPVAVAAPMPVAAPAAEMPAPPTFMTAPPAPVAAVPFSDGKGLIDYVMSSYKSLGAKGQKIQDVLTGLGYQNINDVKPEHYAPLYVGVEALKA